MIKGSQDTGIFLGIYICVVYLIQLKRNEGNPN